MSCTVRIHYFDVTDCIALEDCLSEKSVTGSDWIDGNHASKCGCPWVLFPKDVVDSALEQTGLRIERMSAKQN